MSEIVRNAIEKEGVIAIVRKLYGEPLMQLAEALYAGGVTLMEVTFDQAAPDVLPKTAAAIGELAERMKGRMHVGAGTVLTVEQVRVAAEAGAQFIISPNTDPLVIAETKAFGLVSVPGAMTPSEMVTADQAGADFVKVFPSIDLGVRFLKNVMAPLNHIKFIVTGGVTLMNFEEWLRAGAIGAGIGGYLSDKKLIEAGDWAEFTRRAKAFCDIVAKVRG